MKRKEKEESSRNSPSRKPSFAHCTGPASAFGLIWHFSSALSPSITYTSAGATLKYLPLSCSFEVERELDEEEEEEEDDEEM